MHNNNFDFLRLCFAFCVVVTHCYAASGTGPCDLLCRFSGYQVNFAYIGVRGFFVISGYLVFQSLLRSTTPVHYYRNRFLRIFPALFTVLFLTVLLAPFVYRHSLPYLENHTVYTYLPRNLFLFNPQRAITGVFENLPYKSVINVSLWTIPYGFIFYVLLSLLFFFRRYPLAVKTILVIVFLFLGILQLFYTEQLNYYFSNRPYGRLLVNLGLFFTAGSLLAVYRIETSRYKRKIFIGALFLLLVSLRFGLFRTVDFLAFPLTVVLAGIASTRFISKTGRAIGNVSYGVYLYSFPVQQTLMYYFNFSLVELLLASVLVSFLFGLFSWHVIEKRTLKFKKLPGITGNRKHEMETG